MEIPINQIRLCCVNYPGFVLNHDSLMQSIGDLESLGSIMKNPGMRLPVNLDIRNKFARPVYGERKLTDNSLLLKIRVRRKKGAPAKTAKVVKCEVVGVPHLTFEFSSVADFQYLPVEKNSAGEFTDMQKILLGYDIEEPFQPVTDFLAHDLPIVVCPAMFSRFDRPIRYYYRPNPLEFNTAAKKRDRPECDETDEKRAEGSEQPENSEASSSKSGTMIPDSTRRRRLNGTQYLRFTDQTFPNEICPAISATKLTPRMKDISAKLEALFEQKPCWLTKALCYEFRAYQDQQRVLLKGSVQRHAYLCCTGPWSRQWIRLGYDPRKDPQAKYVQTLDYRMPKRFAKSIVSAHTYDSIHTYLKRKVIYGKTPQGEVQTTNEEPIGMKKKAIEKIDFEIYGNELPTSYNTFAQVSL